MSILKPGVCLVVLSGGQDSTTCLFWAKERFHEVHAVTFDYGQRHRIEIDAAKKVADLARVASHEIVEVPGILVSTSPLTSANDLEQYTDAQQMAEVIGSRIEKTFVPMRNTLFLTIAANRAVALGASAIVTGICQEDNANYPDCRDDFRNNLEHTINLSLGLQRWDSASECIRIIAPLMDLDKAASVKLAMRTPGAYDALAYSHTSYDGKYPPTDMNHANVLRAAGFEAAGVPDPLVVRAVHEGLMVVPTTPNYEAFRRTGELPEVAKLTHKTTY